jgi:hypothetical protein
VNTLWMCTKRRCMLSVLPTGNFVILERNHAIIMLFVYLLDGVYVYRGRRRRHLQLPVQSMPVTTKVVSSNPVLDESYSIQHYVIHFVIVLRQFNGLFSSSDNITYNISCLCTCSFLLNCNP